MKAIVIDTETTGMDDPVPIEIAWLEFTPVDKLTRPLETFCRRYNPGKTKISYGAMATHSILPEDVEKCESYKTFMPPGVQYLIGHNIDYDWHVISPMWPADLTIPDRICTLALARKYLDIDSHTLGACILYLYRDNLDVGLKFIRGAHSAGQDCRNASQLAWYFYSMAMERTGSKDFSRNLAELYRMSEEARIPTKITFGKHSGTAIKDLPADYVSWLLKQDWLDPYLRRALEAGSQAKLPL